MSDFERAGEALATFVKTYVPLASAAALQVDSYDGSTLVLSAPLDKNINDKGTAFGGSLYNLCVTAGWGMTSLKCQELGLTGDIVVAKGEIEYLAPLKSRLIATILAPTDEQLRHFKDSYTRRGRAAITQSVVIPDESGAPCARFVGRYAIVK